MPTIFPHHQSSISFIEIGACAIHRMFQWMRLFSILDYPLDQWHAPMTLHARVKIPATLTTTHIIRSLLMLISSLLKNWHFHNLGSAVIIIPIGLDLMNPQEQFRVRPTKETFSDIRNSIGQSRRFALGDDQIAHPFIHARQPSQTVFPAILHGSHYPSPIGFVRPWSSSC